VQIGDENPHPSGTRQFFSWQGRMNQMIEKKKRKEDLEKRSGWKVFYEHLGKMIYRAYPHGQIFDIQTGELIDFEERPGIFIQAAIREADKRRDEWIKERERQ
jgi:hypothetical protein